MRPRVSTVFDLSNAFVATVWYVAITLVITWPLARGLASDVPGDLGDPLFVSWVIARAGDHWLALLGGDLGAIGRFWHAGIFHPETLTIAMSEHFVAHALLVLPVWAATRNIVLSYNLLLIASYVLSGVGMYLLVRNLTGHPRAAFVAGLAFLCAPYRVASLSHLQTMSSQWMPFALLGLRRYLASGSYRALGGGVAAIWLQNLSSGYYLVYFAPFAGLYAVAEMAGRSLLQRWQVWRDLIIAGLAGLALTLPFAVPYLILQNRFQYRVPLEAIAVFSANGLSWLTADPALTVWGWLQAWPAGLGRLFPGVAIAALALLGAWCALRRPEDVSGDPRRLTRAVALVALGGATLAVWLAFGPSPHIGEQPLALPPLFRLLYDYLPGFNVARVPARYAMIVALLMALLAGYGAAWIGRTRARGMLLVAAVAVVLDGAAWPFPMNRVFSTSADVNAPAALVHPERSAPRVWAYLRTLPSSAVIAHLPFGYPEYELRYVYYSSVAPHRMINGYSSALPLTYRRRLPALQRPLADPAAAMEQLLADGVTHVVVHAGAWPDDTGKRIGAWLTASGAMRMGSFDDATVFALPR